MIIYGCFRRGMVWEELSLIIYWCLFQTRHCPCPYGRSYLRCRRIRWWYMLWHCREIWPCLWQVDFYIIYECQERRCWCDSIKCKVANIYKTSSWTMSVDLLVFFCPFLVIIGGHRGRDHMVVGFRTTYGISAYHHWCCEFIHVIELLCYNWRFANFWLEIWSHNWRFFIDVFDACFYCLLMFSFCLFQYWTNCIPFQYILFTFLSY